MRTSLSFAARKLLGVRARSARLFISNLSDSSHGLQSNPIACREHTKSDRFLVPRALVSKDASRGMDHRRTYQTISEYVCKSILALLSPRCNRNESKTRAAQRNRQVVSLFEERYIDKWSEE